MAFILWRETGGVREYVTAWAGMTAAHSPNRENALRYQTLAAAQAAIASRTPAGWQVEEVADGT